MAAVADEDVKLNVASELLQLARELGEIRGILVGIQSTLQTGATRMDGLERRVHDLEISAAKHAAYAAGASLIVSIVAQQIIARFF